LRIGAAADVGEFVAETVLAPGVPLARSQWLTRSCPHPHRLAGLLWALAGPPMGFRRARHSIHRTAADGGAVLATFAEGTAWV